MDATASREAVEKNHRSSLESSSPNLGFEKKAEKGTSSHGAGVKAKPRAGGIH